MSAELNALLAACRAAPADDLPRLVLADWLDEYGDPDRAEFIRVQCELARTTIANERRRELLATEQQLLAAHWQRWTAGLTITHNGNLYEFSYGGWKYSNTHWLHDDLAEPPRLVVLRSPEGLVGTTWLFLDWRFHRGLIACRRWVGAEDAGPLAAMMATPAGGWLETIELLMTHAELVAFSCPLGQTRWATTVNLNPWRPAETPGEWQSLVRSGNFALVRALSVPLEAVDVVVATAADRSAVERLILAAPAREMDAALLAGRLPDPGLTSDDARVVRLLSVGWPGLRRVDLGGMSSQRCRLTPAFWRAMADRWPPDLAHLQANVSLRDGGLAALLADPPPVTTLELPELHHAGLSDAEVVALASSPVFAALSGPAYVGPVGPQLNLSGNRVGDAGLAALARNPSLARFRELSLRENRVSDAGVAALSVSPFARNLTHLDLWRNAVTDAGAAVLATSGIGFIDLNLRENRLTAAGEQRLRDRYGDRAKV